MYRTLSVATLTIAASTVLPGSAVGQNLPPCLARPAPVAVPFAGSSYSFTSPGTAAAYYAPSYPAYPGPMSVPVYYPPTTTSYYRSAYLNPGPYYYTPAYSYTPGYYSYYYTPGYFRN